MDPSRIHGYRSRATKKQQLLNDVILYSLTTLACTSFCSSPFWYPPFCATFNVFFFFSLPKITSFFFTSKALFITANLIVLFLLGESNFFASKSKCNHIDQLQTISPAQERTVMMIGNGALEQEKQVNIFPLKTCNEDEFFELCDDDHETCVSDVDNTTKSIGDHEEEDLSYSKDEVKVFEEEKKQGLEGDGKVGLPAEELNKMVDDFIARIIKQRRLEA